MTHSFPSNSCIKADQSVWLLADTYNFKGLPSYGGTSTGGAFMYSLISSNAFYCMSPHLNSWSAFSFNRGENGNIFSDRFEMNLLMKLILPIKDRSWVLFVGGPASSIAFILFCPTSIPFCAPRNLRILRSILQKHICLDSSSSHVSSCTLEFPVGQCHTPKFLILGCA